jgi:hypothetical protein
MWLRQQQEKSGKEEKEIAVDNNRHPIKERSHKSCAKLA